MEGVLVEPRWLQERLQANDPDLRIFDCTLWLTGLLEEEYRSRHIAGAQFLSVFEGAAASLLRPLAVPDLTSFQAYVRRLGVSDRTHVVLYETADMAPFSAARLWWTFRLYGHDKVSVLNGGLRRWIREGLPTSSDPVPTPKEGDFTGRLRAELQVGMEWLLPGKLPPGTQVLDARLPEFFHSKEEEPSSMLQQFAPCIRLPLDQIKLATGHIPGSLNLPYTALCFENAQDTFKDRESLSKLFQQAGVDLGRPLVVTCYVGVTACLLALAAALCGKRDVMVYPGSWVEYGQKATPEMVEQ